MKALLDRMPMKQERQLLTRTVSQTCKRPCMRAYKMMVPLSGLLAALLAGSGLAHWRRRGQRKHENARLLDQVFEARNRQSDERGRLLTGESQASSLP